MQDEAPKGGAHMLGSHRTMTADVITFHTGFTIGFERGTPPGPPCLYQLHPALKVDADFLL